MSYRNKSYITVAVGEVHFVACLQSKRCQEINKFSREYNGSGNFFKPK